MTALWQHQPVGIVGLGLIGGSLGLDLLARGAEVRALVHRPASAERARQRRLATVVSTDAGVLAGCGMVVLALPLDRLLAPDPILVEALSAAAVVTDVGSVKASVLACWGPRLRGRFVASHPMAGTARGGVEAGQLDLFRGRPWVATPDATTAAPALQAVRELAEALGATWLTCEAAAHDRAVALISHLPVLVSAALLQTADQATAAAPPLASLVRALASSGFADTSRVGGGNPELGALMARCNQGALLAALDRYREAITDLETLVRAGEWEVLQQELASCQQLRPSFL